jgi:hypothetical protein
MNRNTINKMIDCSDDFPEGEPFDLTEYIIGITRKDWICQTAYYNKIQMVALFEILDLEDCGILKSEEELEFPISIQSALMVHPKLFSQTYVKDFIEEESSLQDGKYPVRWALSDAYGYGGGVPFNMDSVKSNIKCDVVSKISEDENFGSYRRFKTMDDADKYIREVYCHNVNAVMGLIGFYLDGHVNRIGTTGWDFIYHMTEGRDLFQPAFDRHKEAVNKGSK